jgi:hypothetical protein
MALPDGLRDGKGGTVVGVKEETINSYGAVSSQVAEEMALGGRKVLAVDICLADTGSLINSDSFMFTNPLKEIFGTFKFKKSTGEMLKKVDKETWNR